MAPLPSPVRRAGRAARRTVAARTIESRLLWILGSPRSGSTWLHDQLREHEAVVSVNEPIIGLYLGPFLSDLPGWDPKNLDVSNFTQRKVHPGGRDQFFAEEFAGAWAPALGEMIRRRFLEHSLRYPPSGGRPERAIVSIKEPNGSQSADILMRVLPRSRLLFLLRDGRDVVDSQVAAHAKGGWLAASFPGAPEIGESERLAFVETCASKWLWRTQVVEEAYARHPGPKLTVRYEQLRAEPLDGMREVLDWLGLRYDEAWLRDLVDQRSFERLRPAETGAQSFARSASPGRWRENLGADEQAAMHAIFGAKLAELGYEA